MSRGRCVTEEQAKEILEKLDPWLDKRPRSTSSRSGSMRRWRRYGRLHCIAGLYVDARRRDSRTLRRAFPAAKFHLSAMEAAAKLTGDCSHSWNC